MRDLHPYFSGPCELHFPILGSHARLVGSSHKMMAQISSLDPIIEVIILHLDICSCLGSPVPSNSLRKAKGLVELSNFEVAFSKTGSKVILILVLQPMDIFRKEKWGTTGYQKL